MKPVNPMIEGSITLNTFQAEIIEQALAWHEIKCRDLSDDAFLGGELFEGCTQEQRDEDMREYYAEATAAYEMRKKIIALFNMGHVAL